MTDNNAIDEKEETKPPIPERAIRRTTTKRLPWLDAKPVRSATAATVVRGQEKANSSKNSSSSSNRKKSTRVTPKSPVASSNVQKRPMHPSGTHIPSASLPFHNKSHQKSLAHCGTIVSRQQSSAVPNAHQSTSRVPKNLKKLPSREPQRLPGQHDGGHNTSPTSSREHMSPSQPVPIRSGFIKRDDAKIMNTVDNLEEMVQEAIDIAEKTTDRKEVEDIYKIVEEAKKVIQEASEEPTRHDIAPLNVQKLPLATEGGQRHSVAFDFAYQQPKSQTPLSASSTSSSTSDHGSSQHDLLLPPQPVRSTPREHSDFVLRPMLRDKPHRRSRQQHSSDSGGCKHFHECQPRFRPRDRRRIHKDYSYCQTDSSLDEGNVIPGDHMDEDPHTFTRRRNYRRQPIARHWHQGKKRLTAMVACINTALLGIIVGIYAGEVPRIQYFLADEKHIAIVGNAVLYFGLAISTFVVWPLPLLHGRKPYLLTALVLALPLQFPQAMVLSQRRSPNDTRYRVGLLCARAATGLVLGFANINYFTVLLDLFGASLQSENPHQEIVIANDARRQGGGMGMWLGVWSWCWIASLAVGFQIGAAIIETLSPDWGFYVVVIILVAALFLNIITSETRRAPYRKAVTELYDRDENFITRRVSRGECKLHISNEGPLYWFEEVWAGMKLVAMMMCQPGFCIMSFYLGWIYAQIVLVIVLLGALLSKDYKWQPRLVGAGVMSIAIGAFLAIPLTKARIFSRERKKAFRTDSMTFQKQVTWSSHLVRRMVFTITLPLVGLAYTLSAAGVPKPYMVPIVSAGALGFLSVLGIAECHGLIMETFDTCDLQPGVNTRHRLESMAIEDRRRRTNYSSFPRVTAGVFASQTIAFTLAGVATLVGGNMTRRLGAQTSTGVTAGILLGLTILLTIVLWRFKEVQVIPNHTFGTRRDTAAWAEFKDLEKAGRGEDWKAVVIGNPSGKMRRMSVLELGRLSRWTKIRKLNFLLKGPRLGEATKKRQGFEHGW